MCGLVAVISTTKQGVDSFGSAPCLSINRMIDSIEHRGPDGRGFSIADGVWLGHCRLSIVGGASGAQPIKKDRFDLVFNGEIYNYKDLAVEIGICDYESSNISDSEVLIFAFEKYGVGVFSKLNGIFSLVIHDKQEGLVYVCRDRFGVKPLYLSDDINGSVVVSSEISGVLAYSNEFNHELDPLSIDNYMRLGYVLEPKTIYKNLRILEPGSYEVFSVNEKTHKKEFYYSLLGNMKPNLPPRRIDGERVLSAAIKEQGNILNGVKKSAAIYLSGGLDSSIIAKYMNDRRGGYHSYTIGFDDLAFSEVDEVKVFTKKEKIKNKNIILDKEQLLMASEIIDIFDSPFADNASMPAYYLADMAKDDGFKVSVTGDGADELFFGYRNHRLMFAEQNIKNLIPKFIRTKVIKNIAKIYPNHSSIPRFLRAKSTLSSLGMSFPESYCEAMSLSNSTLVDLIYSDDFKNTLGKKNTLSEFKSIATKFEETYPVSSINDHMKLMQYLDFKTYLPGSILQKTDRTSMRKGIEARVPFLDHRITDLVLGNDSSENIGYSHHKTSLRYWVRDNLVDEDRNKVKKSFTSPLDKWFREIEYSRFIRMVVSESLMDSKMFNIDKLHDIMNDHYYGRKNYGTTLWSLVVLSKFLDKSQGKINYA